jgi:hypothetical protein
MLLNNEQYGEIVSTAMRDGLSAEKAVEVADLANAWAAKHERCDDCQGGDVCTGCKDHAEPQWDHKDFHAERISDSLIRYTRKEPGDDDAGIDDEGQAVLDEFKKWTERQKKTVEAVGNEMDALKLSTERSTKKLNFANDLLTKQERLITAQQREIIRKNEQITQLETRLKSAARPVFSHTTEQRQQPQQARPVKKCGIDPFNHDRFDMPRCPESVNYLEPKAKSEDNWSNCP